MMRNGRKSCGQKLRHIDIRYFWMQDCIAKGEINLVHCPTEIMITDFFTKPLQGSLFKRMKAVIMGETDEESFMSGMPNSSKERVEKHGKVSKVDLSRQTDEQIMEREERDKRIVKYEEHDIDVSDDVERDGRQNASEPSIIKGSKRVSYADIVSERKVKIMK